MSTLKRVFGFDQLRPGQEAVISAVLAGRSAAAIFPTGSGKSLCYQLPALHLPHLTLVISPLLALMQGRISLVTDDGKMLQKARFGTAMLIDLMMHEARQKGWSKPDEFFLNLALANRRHLFPFTD